MFTSDTTFCWTQAYSVNIAVLDQQHQELFEIVGELERAVHEGNGNTAVDPILHKLVHYALSHFIAEESLMRQHGFPGLLAHCQQHQMFRAKIAKFLEDHRAGKAGVPVSLLRFMQDWLKNHVLKTDKQYSSFLNTHGVY
jgi:hemerythrin-like metal-binding protein